MVGLMLEKADFQMNSECTCVQDDYSPVVVTWELCGMYSEVGGCMLQNVRAVTVPHLLHTGFLVVE